MSQFDPKKPVQTRGGRTVRIICTDRSYDWPIVALVTREDGTEMVSSHKRDGTCCITAHDLVNIPEKRYVNLYRITADGSLHVGVEHTSMADAQRNSLQQRIGCYIKTVEIEI